MNKNPNNIDLHVFENHHTYDLQLPKPTFQGFTLINPKRQFVADASFLEYLKTGMIRYIGPHKKKEEVIVESKLLVEQPATVTYHGKVENVVCKTSAKVVLKDGTNNEEENVLLNEGPSDGIKIIND